MSADADDLLGWRAELPALADSVYLVSHSLGAMPRGAHDSVREFLDRWVAKGIVAWDEWLPEVTRAGDRIGRIIGAPAASVAIHTNVSTTQAVVASCLDYTGPRRRIVYDELQFPTVSYVWQAEARRGAELVVVASPDGIRADTDALCAAIDERTLLVPISHVLFRSSWVQQVERILRRAREVGAWVCLDLYQSAGTIPVDVTALGVELAVGGSVKWLCGGPGCGYLYVRPDLLPALEPRVTGWFGHTRPFAFEMPAQRYAETTWRVMGGTPAIAPLYQARPGAEIIASIGVERIRAKSLRQTARLIQAVDEHGWTLRSPREDDRRGGTVCFDFEDAGAVAKELCRRRFYCDHRPGSGIRASPHFYTKDEEIDLFVAEVERIIG